MLPSACFCQASLKAHSVSFCLQGKTADTEPWYGTAYSCQPIPEEWLQQWKGVGAHDSGLHLPEENPFIPTDLLMLEVSEPQSAGMLADGCLGARVAEHCQVGCSPAKSTFRLTPSRMLSSSSLSTWLPGCVCCPSPSL